MLAAGWGGPLGGCGSMLIPGPGEPRPSDGVGPAGDWAWEIAEGGIRLAWPAAVGWVAALMAEARMGAGPC